MAVCSFVVRRCQRYYFRIRVPRPLALATGRSQVVLSLKTANLGTAKIFSARMFFSFASTCAEMNLMIEDAKYSSTAGPGQAHRLI